MKKMETDIIVAAAGLSGLAAAISAAENGARISKTLSFKQDEHALLVVTAGDQKVDNRKFKDYFGIKAKMLTPGEVDEMVGHSVGGVCPFAVSEDVEIYLDESMKRFETVFPACGSSSSAIELSCEELYKYSRAKGWIDVCKCYN